MGLSNTLQEPELDLLHATVMAISLLVGNGYVRVVDNKACYSIRIETAYEEDLVRLYLGYITISCDVNRTFLWDNHEQLKTILETHGVSIINYAERFINGHKAAQDRLRKAKAKP